MARRRQLLGGLAAGGIGGLAGCADLIDFLVGEELAFDASPGAVPNGTLTETGYELAAQEPINVEETFAVADQERTVRVTNWQTTYEKTVSLVPEELEPDQDIDGEIGLDIEVEGVDTEAEAAFFAVLTSPQVRLFGQEFNPVAEWDATDFVDQVQEQYEDLQDPERVDDYEVTVLGTSQTITEFEAEAELLGVGQIPITLHVGTAIESGEDFVVPIGGYPTVVDPTERDNVEAMMGAIEHPVSPQED